MGDAKNTQKIVDSQNNLITYIQPDIINENNFSLNLFGEQTTDLYKALNNNFIKLVQNFYGDEQPINPIIGQNWLNKQDNILYKWYGNNWVQSERDNIYDAFMYVMYDIGNTKEFVLDEFVFNFTINNIKLYDQNMQDVKFIIDAFDSRKIILKQSNIDTLYIMVFHPKDRVTNPYINRKIEIYTESGQTQFDISAFLNENNLNTLSVSLNDIMLNNNEFYVVNNTLNIDGMIYRVRKDDKLSIWLYGGSLSGYYSNLFIHTNKRSNFLRIPQFFKNIVNIDIIDVDSKTNINPIEVLEFDDYINFEFLDLKNIKAKIYIRII